MATYADPYDELRRPAMGQAAPINAQTIVGSDMSVKKAGPDPRYLPPTASPRPQSTAEELAMNRQRLGYADPMSRALARFAQPQRKSILDRQAETKLKSGFGSPQARRALAEKESAYERRMSRFADLLTAQGIEESRAIGQGRAAEATAQGRVGAAELAGKAKVEAADIATQGKVRAEEIKADAAKVGHKAYVDAAMANNASRQSIAGMEDITARRGQDVEAYKARLASATEADKMQIEKDNERIAKISGALGPMYKDLMLFSNQKGVDPVAVQNLADQVDIYETALSKSLTGDTPSSAAAVPAPVQGAPSPSPAPAQGGAGGAGMADANQNGTPDAIEGPAKWLVDNEANPGAAPKFVDIRSRLETRYGADTVKQAIDAERKRRQQMAKAGA